MKHKSRSSWLLVAWAVAPCPATRAGVLEIEGQDSDKEWCEPVVILSSHWLMLSEALVRFPER